MPVWQSSAVILLLSGLCWKRHRTPWEGRRLRPLGDPAHLAGCALNVPTLLKDTCHGGLWRMEDPSSVCPSSLFISLFMLVGIWSSSLLESPSPKGLPSSWSPEGQTGQGVLPLLSKFYILTPTFLWLMCKGQHPSRLDVLPP